MKVFAVIFFIAFSFPIFASSYNFQIDSTTDIADLKGQVVYVDFWASWCKPCRASFPWMNQIHAKYKEQGLRVVAVNLDENPENAALFLQKLPAKFPIVYDKDGKIAERYELVGMPSSYLIDKSGKLRVVHQGFFIAKADAYENEIKQLLSE